MSSERTTPRWPSLYNLNIELFPVGHRAPVQPGGSYLYDSNEIFRFTLYWTLVFYGPAYILCATYAFLNLTFPPARSNHQRETHKRPSFSLRLPSSYFTGPTVEIQLQSYSTRFPDRNPSTNDTPKDNLARLYRTRSKPNEKRSRLTFALIVFLAFAVFSVAGAVVGSAVIGYVLAGLFKAGHYNMSTWIPFLGGLLQTLVGFMGYAFFSTIPFDKILTMHGS
ncbi:hypothetical protein AcW2_005679 [Taiwanofungus camphoratus]|nr:hypothetical protein AcW2_005679 [Antrodia cinnamomea]